MSNNQTIKDRVVLITGASSGIGMACAKTFGRNGAKLILAARRTDRLKELAKELRQRYGTRSTVLKLDVRNKKEVEKAIGSLAAGWKKIDILVNNAGLSRGLNFLYEGDIRDWEEMIDTNIKGLLYVSRYVIPLMVKRNTGHVINIGSIAGREVYPRGNVYCSTKHAVDSITKGMRLDLNGTNIRVSTIDPGLVKTEFSMVRFRGNKKRAEEVYKGIEALAPEDVADAVMYAATRRNNVVVGEILLLPVCQASTTLVKRKT